MKLINWEALDILSKWTNNSIDFIFADLPYSNKKIKRVTANKWDVWIDLEKLFIEFNRILKDDWVIVMTATNPFSSILLFRSIELQEKYKWDLKYKYEWIWQKDNFTNFTSINRQPWRIHEHILVFWKKATTYAWKNATKDSYLRYNPQKTEGKPYAMMSWKWTSNLAYSKESLSVWIENKWEREPITIQKFKRDKSPKWEWHPTQKPVKLIEYLLKTYTKEWDLILDPTMWVGSTWVAAKNLNRDFIWIELNKEYFDIAKDRINNINK